jgi:hypothetical protein
VARRDSQTKPSAAQPSLFEGPIGGFRPTGAARVAALARQPWRPRSDAERRAEEEHATVDRLRTQGAELARRFGLRFSLLEAEREGVNEHYGICFHDGRIRIRLRHAVTGRFLKESSLVDTLCHELAHLRHFDHSKRFWRFYEKILREAHELGYYRPGPERKARVRQRSLFELLAPRGARAQQERRAAPAPDPSPR